MTEHQSLVAVRVIYPLFAMLSWVIGVFALVSHSPRDFGRMVIERPDTVTAHLKSFVTYVEWATASSSGVEVIVVVCAFVFVCSVSATGAALIVGDPA